MIIDVEQEKADDLDECRLAERAMLMMGLSKMCEGSLATIVQSDSLVYQCSECAYRFRSSAIPHPRIPKPLKEVRDELLEWLNLQGIMWAFWGSSAGYRVTLTREYMSRPDVVVSFAESEDEGLALALGAVRLLGEKQDANTE